MSPAIRAHTLPAPAPAILSVQYLRAAAALAAAAAHIAGHAGWSLQTGAAGVDVFFVISGFIMWAVAAPRAPRPFPFLLDRITRVGPPYLLLTLAVYLIATRIPGAFPNMRPTLGHTVLSLLFVPHRDPYGTAFPLVVPGWTLNYEVFFYLVFAAGLLAPAKYRLAGITLTLAAFAAAGLALAPGGPALAMATNPLLLEFAAGTLLGAAWCRNTLPAPAAGWLALAAGLASLAAWQICRGTEPTTWRAAIWGIPAALTVLGAVTIERHRPIPALRPLLLLGDASFSIYLLNVFVAAATWRVLGATSPILYAPVALGLSAAAGIVFWRVAERPLTRRTRRWLHRPMMLAATRPPPVHETTLPGR